MLYSEAEAERLRLLLDDMLYNQDLYLFDDIVDIAGQYQAALVCVELDKQIIADIIAASVSSGE